MTRRHEEFSSLVQHKGLPKLLEQHFIVSQEETDKSPFLQLKPNLHCLRKLIPAVAMCLQY